MEKINDAIRKKATQNGITSESYYANYKFSEFNLTYSSAKYASNIIAECKVCKFDNLCYRHKYLEKSFLKEEKMGK